MAPTRPNGLTTRVLEVLRLLVDGRSNHQIAQELVVARARLRGLRTASRPGRTSSTPPRQRLGLLASGTGRSHTERVTSTPNPPVEPRPDLVEAALPCLPAGSDVRQAFIAAIIVL